MLFHRLEGPFLPLGNTIISSGVLKALDPLNYQTEEYFWSVLVLKSHFYISSEVFVMQISHKLFSSKICNISVQTNSIHTAYCIFCEVDVENQEGQENGSVARKLEGGG